VGLKNVDKEFWTGLYAVPESTLLCGEVGGIVATLNARINKYNFKTGDHLAWLDANIKIFIYPLCTTLRVSIFNASSLGMSNNVSSGDLQHLFVRFNGERVFS
jgi:hypothetical protein